MDQATVKVVLRVKPEEGKSPTDSVTVVDEGQVGSSTPTHSTPPNPLLYCPSPLHFDPGNLPTSLLGIHPLLWLAWVVLSWLGWTAERHGHPQKDSKVSRVVPGVFGWNGIITAFHGGQVWGSCALGLGTRCLLPRWWMCVSVQVFVVVFREEFWKRKCDR